MKNWFKHWGGILEHMVMWGLIFLFIKWFVSNLFGKHAIAFWVWLGAWVFLYLNAIYKWYPY